MEEEKKNNRGGKRAGAGRKPTGKIKDKTLSVVGTKSELDRLREKARENNISVSKYILESLNCLDSQN